MILELKVDYKSLKPFKSEILNDLTIITGKNGSGKTHLLQLLSENSTSGKNSPTLSMDPKVQKVQFEGIIKDKNINLSHESYKDIIDSYIDQYGRMQKNELDLVKFLLNNNLLAKAIDEKRKDLLSKDDEYTEIIRKLYRDIYSENDIIINDYEKEKLGLKSFFSRNLNLIEFLQDAIYYHNKDLLSLNKVDYYNTPIKEHLMDTNNIFSSQFENVFYNYSRRREINRYGYYKKISGTKNNTSLSDEEFAKQFPPPWITLNKILEKHNIGFYSDGIDIEDFSIDVPVVFKWYKSSTDGIIPFNDLSSGEKVIIGLVLKLFTGEYYKKNLSYPDLLLLDEPDAHLHPEMSKLLLDILRDTFVKTYGIKVILTTHSPSTIALAQEGEIYQIKNESESSLRNITKDEALNILTSFIPTLSIDYRNHRHVFVEGPIDLFYYQTIFDLLNQDINFDYKLYFLSNGYGKGNCDQVEKIVKDIRNCGNATFFGIIDWDRLDKIRPDNIFVHGLSSRYSIENFLFDPVYLCIFFLKNEDMNLRRVLGLTTAYNEYLIVNDEDKLKALVKWFFEYVQDKKPYYKLTNISRLVYYGNGKSLELPEWYLERDGHDLAEFLINIFPALQGFARREIELMNELIKIVGKVYPFVPKETTDLMKEIVSAG